MANRKSNKTEHVLKLITKNQEQEGEYVSAEDEVAQAQVGETEEIEFGIQEEKASQENIVPEVTQVNVVSEVAQVNVISDVVQIEQTEKITKEEPSTKLINLAEVLALEMIDEIMDKMKICKCKSCKNDILALALNTLPHLYVTTDSGKQYVKLNNYKSHYETDVVAAITRACVKVKAKPRHPIY